MADVLIVGGGAAGYTAGILAARDRRRAPLIETFSEGRHLVASATIAGGAKRIELLSDGSPCVSY